MINPKLPRILLTGKIKTGKSTIVKKFIDNIPVEDREGFITCGMFDGNGERYGFELVSSNGDEALFASKREKAGVPFGNHHLSLDALEDFLEKIPPSKEKQVLFIDEIGDMQLMSEKFRMLAKEYLSKNNLLIATIKLSSNDELVKEIRERKDVILFELTFDNREMVSKIFDSFAKNHKLLYQLNQKQVDYFTKTARKFLGNDNLTLVYKLFNNSLKYVTDGLVKKSSGTRYVVEGNHKEHIVIYDKGKYVCDCDLFNGRGKYGGHTGMCSHVMSVEMYLLEKTP
jgi:nucleoside-triphosphatase THEP1